MARRDPRIYYTTALFIHSEPSMYAGEQNADRTTGELLDEVKLTLIDAEIGWAATIDVRFPSASVPKGLVAGNPVSLGAVFKGGYMSRDGAFRETWEISDLKAAGQKVA